MGVMVAVAARLLVPAAAVIITPGSCRWLFNKLRSPWAGSRSPDPVILEKTKTTTAAASFPPAVEQIQFEEGKAFIEGESAAALDSIATANATAIAAVTSPPATEQNQFKEDEVFIEGESAAALDSIATANAAVASPPASEQIQFKDDKTFIEGECPAALDSIATANAAVATPPAAEQIQFKEDMAFIEGESAAALNSIATANAAAIGGGGGDGGGGGGGGGGWISYIYRWISDIDPQVLARLLRVAGRIVWAVVDSYVEGSLLKGCRVWRAVYYAVRGELRRS